MYNGRFKIWCSTTHVEITTKYCKCTALKYTYANVLLGTQLKCKSTIE